MAVLAAPARWQCDICDRTKDNKYKADHLGGKAHALCVSTGKTHAQALLFVKEERREKKALKLLTPKVCVRDVKRTFGHLCEIPLSDYCEAVVAHSRNDLVDAF